MQRSQHDVTTSDGVRIAFHLYHQAGRNAVAIICPGFFQSKETPTFRRLACLLASCCDVVCMDFRGHGRSGGRFTFSAKEPADLEAVLGWARRRYQRIGLVGFSLGAAISIHVASRHPELHTLIAICGPSGFEEIEFRWWTKEAIGSGLRGLEPGAGCRMGSLWFKKERAIDTVKRVSPIPLLLIHGTRDQTVSPRHSERLYGAAGQPKQLIYIDGGHAQDLFRRQAARWWPIVRDWLKTTLVGSPEPGGSVRHEDGYIDVRPGLALYHQHWSGTESKKPLVIVHGAGEHSGRYRDTATRLIRQGFHVHAVDLPGHGRSPGIRGHISHFEEYLTAIERFVADVTARHHGDRPVLLGHSLGGLIATWYAIRFPETIRGVVLSSPLWGLNVPVPYWKRALAHILSPLWPSLTMERPRSSERALSHDVQVGLDYASDPLVHFRASVRFYTELQQRINALPHGLPRLRLPLLVLQGGGDRIASADAVRRLFPAAASQQKRLIVYDGYYHEVLNETGKEQVFTDMEHWLRAMGLLPVRSSTESSPLSG